MVEFKLNVARWEREKLPPAYSLSAWTKPAQAFIPWASSGEPTKRGGISTWTLDKSLSGLT